MSNILPGLIERFFTQRLMRQRNAKLSHRVAYRDTFELLLGSAHAARASGRQRSTSATLTPI